MRFLLPWIFDSSFPASSQLLPLLPKVSIKSSERILQVRDSGKKLRQEKNHFRTINVIKCENLPVLDHRAVSKDQSGCGVSPWAWLIVVQKWVGRFFDSPQ